MVKALKDYSLTFTNDEDRANFGRLSAAWDAYLPLTKKAMDLGLLNRNAEAAAVMRPPEMAKARADIAAEVKVITDFNVKNVEQSNVDNARMAGTSIAIMLAIIAVAFIVSMTLGILITNSVAASVGGEPEEIAAVAAPKAPGPRGETGPSPRTPLGQGIAVKETATAIAPITSAHDSDFEEF
jgi:methyl-accepting chemotaxis protein